MDETLVWSDMVFEIIVEKTGAQTVRMKSKDHEKYQVSVCLTPLRLIKQPQRAISDYV